MTASTKQRALVPLRATATRVGESVSSIRRKAKDPASGFPTPLNVNNRLFFYSDELDQYVESRPGITERPTVKANDKSVEAA
jgi:predicted DNA-binding transcriptional regulator AlpA